MISCRILPDLMIITFKKYSETISRTVREKRRIIHGILKFKKTPERDKIMT